jgi:hypothetical protein
MLKSILETIKANSETGSPPTSHPPQVKTLLHLLIACDVAMNRDDLQVALGLSDRKSFRESYLKAALEAKLIKMAVPVKPNSRLQKYEMTEQSRLMGRNKKAP